MTAWIAAWPSPVDAERLAVENGAPAGELHVTLAYLHKPGFTLAREFLTTYLRAHVAHVFPTTGLISGTACFHSADEDGEPLDHHVLLVRSAGLDQAAEQIRADFPNIVDATYPWNPHVTVRSGGPEPYWPRARGSVTFDRLVLVWEGERIDLTEGRERE